MRVHHPSEYQIVPFPRLQLQMMDWLELMHHQHTIYILTEVDATQARRDIHAYRATTGTPLSFTAFITSCFARAIAEHKLLHAYRKGRGELVLFEDVDVTVAVERLAEEQYIPVPLIIRAANTKTCSEKELIEHSSGLLHENGIANCGQVESMPLDTMADTLEAATASLG